MHEAAAGETHELRLEVGDDLREVGAQAVGTIVKRLARKERDHVQADRTSAGHNNHEPRVGISRARFDRGGELAPVCFQLG